MNFGFWMGKLVTLSTQVCILYVELQKSYNFYVESIYVYMYICMYKAMYTFNISHSYVWQIN